MAFAAKVERSEILTGVALLDTDLTEHITFLTAALRPHTDELGIGGRTATS